MVEPLKAARAKQIPEGPWKFSKSAAGMIFVWSADGHCISTVYSENEPAARLIASAPDLLEAAKLALNYITNTEGEFGIQLDSGNALRAAISKASSSSPQGGSPTTQMIGDE